MRVYQLCRRKSKEFVDILNKDMKNSNDEEHRFVIHVTKDEWNNRLNDMIVCYEQRFKFKQEIFGKFLIIINLLKAIVNI